MSEVEIICLMAASLLSAGRDPSDAVREAIVLRRAVLRHVNGLPDRRLVDMDEVELEKVKAEEDAAVAREHEKERGSRG